MRDWIERAEHFLKELDARLEGILMKDGPFAPEWVLYGHSTSLRLRGIEEVCLQWLRGKYIDLSDVVVFCPSLCPSLCSSR